MKIGNKWNYWIIKDNEIDITRGSSSSYKLKVHNEKRITFNPSRSALIIVDMQNFFSSPLLGRSEQALKLVPSVSSAINICRKIGMKVGWVNWGNRLDVANLPPSLQYAFKRKPENPGIGEELAENLGLSLVKDSWSTALIDDLEEIRQENDWWVDKYRMSGFPGTDLDQILRNNDIQTIFFAGVNTDQCVMGTMIDAASLGYDCILLKDCTATTSPHYALEGTLYNVDSFGGFITTTNNMKDLIQVR